MSMNENEIALLNQTFKISAADGYATYRVTHTYGDGTVQIESVVDGYDNYTAPLLGDGCRISKENVERVIEWNKKWLR